METLYKPTEYFRPFPAPENVFASELDRCAEVLLPMASVSTSHFRPEFDRDVHFVLPIEKWIGEVGENTTSFHSYLCRTNWLGFFIDDRSRYTLATDMRYFFNDPADAADQSLMTDDNLAAGREFYETSRSHFYCEQARFGEHGSIFGRYSKKPVEFVHLGGHQGWPNWAADRSFPFVERSFISPFDGEPDHDYVPIAEDGTEFFFVGWMPAYHYAYEMDCNVYLFYNHENKLALETFDFG